MEYYNQPYWEPSPEDLKKEKRSFRRSFSRIGWAVFTVTVTSLLLVVLLRILLTALEQIGYKTDLFDQLLLIVNQVLITLSILCGALVLIGMPKCVPEKRPISFKAFLLILCICFGIGQIGNLIGSVILMLSNILSGGNASNPVTEIMMSFSPWQLFLCTAIWAPIIEEFFFRKLLIDRIYRHGELAAILTSAALFGLFHQNFSQFFYAFGLGAVLAYLYCKTGSYRLVTLLHMLFNLFAGVIPGILAAKTLSLTENPDALPSLSPETWMEELLPLFSKYGLYLFVYLPYTMLQGAVNVAGVVLFFVFIRRIKLEKSPSLLPKEEQQHAIMINSGMIVCTTLLVVLMVMSLFVA